MATIGEDMQTDDSSFTEVNTSSSGQAESTYEVSPEIAAWVDSCLAFDEELKPNNNSWTTSNLLLPGTSAEHPDIPCQQLDDELFLSSVSLKMHDIDISDGRNSFKQSPLDYLNKHPNVSSKQLDDGSSGPSISGKMSGDDSFDSTRAFKQPLIDNLTERNDMGQFDETSLVKSIYRAIFHDDPPVDLSKSEDVSSPTQPLFLKDEHLKSDGAEGEREEDEDNDTRESEIHMAVDEADKEDATVIRYKGEKYLLKGNTPEERSSDPNLEVPFNPVDNVDSLANIFKVWDINTADDEESELVTELKKVLEEGSAGIASKEEDPISELNSPELDELVNGLTDLSLADNTTKRQHSL